MSYSSNDIAFDVEFPVKDDLYRLMDFLRAAGAEVVRGLADAAYHGFCEGRAV